MISIINDADIFSVPADVLVNPVNCVGVMGAGLAKQFRDRFPEMFIAYQRVCREVRLGPGRLHWWRNSDGVYIVNFPTKVHWRDPSTLEMITEGLDALHADLSNLPSSFLRLPSNLTVFVPALGCGHGGLEWDDVRPLIWEKLKGLSAKVYVFAPPVKSRGSSEFRHGTK